MNHDLLDRIRKLMAMAESNSPSEAAIAASKVQDLLFRHGLSMADLDLADQPSMDATEFTFDTYASWKMSLVTVLADANLCQAARWQTTDRLYLVGAETNVHATWFLYQRIASQLIQMAESAWLNRRGSGGNRRSFTNSFMHGAVWTIKQRLDLQRKQHLMNHPRSTALVLDTTALIDEAWKQALPNTERSTSRTRTPHNPVADRAGRGAGHKVPLEQEIEAGAKALPA